MEIKNNGINDKLFEYIVDSFAHSPFYQLVGIRIQSLGMGTAEIIVSTDVNHTNPLRLIHGGLLMTIADSSMGNALRTLGYRGVTVDCTTSFLAATEFGKDIVAKGEVIKSGRNILFAEARVWSDSKLLATSKATFFRTGTIEL